MEDSGAKVAEIKGFHTRDTSQIPVFICKEKGKKLAKILWVLSEMNAGLAVEDTAEFTDLVSELF